MLQNRVYQLKSASPAKFLDEILQEGFGVEICRNVENRGVLESLERVGRRGRSQMVVVDSLRDEIRLQDAPRLLVSRIQVLRD